MQETTHRLATFDNALREARESVFRMASIAEQNLESAFRGLLTRNAELCNAAIVEDDEVNALEKKIDADSLEILMRYNPVATDLREVIAGMKVANNLERISDEAQNIARRARKVIKSPEIKEVALIEPLYARAVGLLRDGIRSYAEGDVELGISLYAKDKELDKAQNEVIRELTKLMGGGSGKAKSFLHLILIVRSLERVGDHSVNIAEDGIFLESAADIRHLGAKEAAAEVDAQS